MWLTMAESHGPPWTDGGTDRRALGRNGALDRVGPPAVPGHESSPAGVENGGRSMRVLFWASLGLG
jgi:hypothetical protein